MRESPLIGRSKGGRDICQKRLASALRDLYFSTVGMDAQIQSVSVNRYARCASRRCGATLIELLVVITLIALLIGSLLPSVGRSMRVASDAICKHHLRELGRTLMLYEYDNDGWLPTIGESDSVGRSGIEAVRGAEPWFAKQLTP